VKRQQGFAFASPFITEVASAAAVGLVVAAVGTLVIGLFFAKAPVVVASVFCAVFAKISLEIGRRGAAAAGQGADLEVDARDAREPEYRRRDSLASPSMATRPPSERGDPRPAPGAGPASDRDWRFDELFDDDAPPLADAGGRPPTGRPARRPPPPRDAPAGGAPRRVSDGPSGEQLDESLDRFGEHLVRSLNQLFDEYVGEALGHMQAELTAERKDLGDLRTQLKAVVKAGARREEALREELTFSREAVDELRGQLEELREDISAIGSGGDSGLQDDIVQLAEEVRALRKRVSLGGARRPGGAGGLDPDQVQAVADAVTASILDAIQIEPG
jgi:hypothetical protein